MTTHRIRPGNGPLGGLIEALDHLEATGAAKRVVATPTSVRFEGGALRMTLRTTEGKELQMAYHLHPPTLPKGSVEILGVEPHPDGRPRVTLRVDTPKRSR